MFVNRLHSTLSRSKLLNLFFLKLFVLFFLMTSIPVLVVGFLSIANSSAHIIENVSKSNLSMLRSKKLAIDQRLETIDKAMLQSINSPEVWEILRSGSLDSGSHMTMKAIIDSFVTATTSNPMIDSIYFFDTRHDFVLMSYNMTGTKYKKSEFRDQDLLNVDFQGSYRLFRSTGPDGTAELIRYVRKINTFSEENLGYLVYNLKSDLLFEDLDSSVSRNMELAVMGNDSSTFYANGRLFATADSRFAELVAGQETATAVVDFAGTKYFISKVPSDLYAWQYIYIQDYHEMTQAAQMTKKVVLTSLWSVLFVALIVIYMLSSYLYRPLSRLLQRIASVSKPAADLSNNEFKAIDRAIHLLQESNSSLASSVDVTLPYFRRHSICDLLTSDKFDQAEFRKIVDFLGIEMTHETNYVAIVEAEHSSLSDGWQNSFETKMRTQGDGLAVISSRESDYRLILVINTDLPPQQPAAMLANFVRELAPHGNGFILSISEPFRPISRLPDVYQQLLKSHEHKLFFGPLHPVAASDDSAACETDSRASTDALQIRLINYMNSLNRDKAVETLRDMTTDHLKDLPDSNDYIRYVYFHVCTGVINHLQTRGIDVKQLEHTPYSLYIRLQHAENLTALQQFAICLIEDGIAAIAEQRSKSSSDIVEKVVRFIELNYTRDLSLEAVSDSVSLNPRYLSTLFKAEKGMTIFEYITSLRMTRASELLVGTNKRVAEIAADIGFNNVQSFIRTFKQHYKSTPLNYRKINAH